MSQEKSDDSETDKFLMISLDEDSDEEKSKSVAEVLSSKTCKKIINFLASVSEASQQDISKSLKVPMNTLDYNIKKLLASGFIQKKKNFFWSKKGKKIIMYEVSNKSIIISPRKTGKALDKFKSLIPAFLILGSATFASWAYEKIISARNTISPVYEIAKKGTENLMASSASTTPITTPISSGSSISSMLSMPVWGWFLFGGIVVLVVITLVNWKKL